MWVSNSALLEMIRMSPVKSPLLHLGSPLYGMGMRIPSSAKVVYQTLVSMPVHRVASPRERGERETLAPGDQVGADGSGTGAASSHSRRCPPTLPPTRQHPKPWVQLQQGGDAAVPAAGEHLEGAETVVQPSDIEVQACRSHTKVTSGFYSTWMGSSFCFS